MLGEIKSVMEYAYQDLLFEIRAFQDELTDDQEMGAISRSADDVIHISSVDQSPDGQLIVFLGTDGQGRPARLVQHYTQVSIQLVAVGKLDATAKRIGF